ncbi:MAG: TonB C-terminal domain-containing protein, partial [Burkholderiales bacterium]
EKERERELEEKRLKQEEDKQRKDKELKRDLEQKKRKLEEDRQRREKERERELEEKRLKQEEDKQRREKERERELAEKNRQEKLKQEVQKTLDTLKQNNKLQKQQQIEELNKQKAGADAAQAEMQGELDEYIKAITKKVNDSWLFQPNASLQVVYDLVLSETGKVLVVTLVEESGNRAYDESVEKAIRIASPLPVPKDSSFFQKTFGRGVSIKFKF